VDPVRLARSGLCTCPSPCPKTSLNEPRCERMMLNEVWVAAKFPCVAKPSGTRRGGQVLRGHGHDQDSWVHDPVQRAFPQASGIAGADSRRRQRRVGTSDGLAGDVYTELGGELEGSTPAWAVMPSGSGARELTLNHVRMVTRIDVFLCPCVSRGWVFHDRCRRWNRCPCPRA
jgi:hypothetical protein